jgi:hypothetical protein
VPEFQVGSKWGRLLDAESKNPDCSPIFSSALGDVSSPHLPNNSSWIIFVVDYYCDN